jgi:tRNA dimethylallyltransferase
VPSAPLGVYSAKHKDLKALPNGAKIAVPNDPTSMGRALAFLQQQGLLTLDPTVAAGRATERNVTGNPKNLQLVLLDAPQMPRALPEVDAAAILGNHVLAAELNAKDPDAYAAIDPRNERRLLRALEVIEITGKPFGSGLGAEDRPWRPSTVIGLQVPRNELITRLDARVAAMFANGLVDEVRGLVPLGIEQGITASRAIGYAQALGVINGTMTVAEAIDETAALTLKFARRQVGWFGRNSNITWFDASEAAIDALSSIDARE